jgi:hypothetical protein
VAAVQLQQQQQTFLNLSFRNRTGYRPACACPVHERGWRLLLCSNDKRAQRVHLQFLPFRKSDVLWHRSRLAHFGWKEKVCYWTEEPEPKHSNPEHLWILNKGTSEYAVAHSKCVLIRRTGKYMDANNSYRLTQSWKAVCCFMGPEKPPSLQFPLMRS